jgi:endo-1,4-beta-xylanase
MKGNLDRLAATGLPIYISEFDLGNLSNTGTPNDNQQLQLYMKIFPVLWRHLAVKGITLWGYLDGQMWQTTCYLVRSDGSARPALLWLADYVKNNPVGVTETASRLPSAYQLEQNFPNPFNPSTTLRYGLPTRSRVRLQVYNVLGQLVADLVNTEQAVGWNQVVWNVNIASGLYFYRLEATSVSDPSKRFVDVKKMILLK